MAHNAFLDIFYSSGLVGLIAFIIFNVKLFKDGFLICYKPSDILDVIYSGVMVALFSISMLDFGVLYSGLISPMFWIFCGLIIGNAQKKQLSKNEVKS
ncbi:hypothetical protein SDC9_161120 [bioreactor metagenome]|uniref:Uncharacterized protein n=1 Tax=bioreactor metagenome TaxID=1076179 RepID=A0A645FN94_9ZZZZ